MKQYKLIQFAGREITVEELIQLLLIMPEEQQKMIYEHGCRLIAKCQIEVNNGNKIYKINTALLAYICKENRRIKICFLDRRKPEYIDKISLTEFEVCLNAHKNLVNPFLRLKSIIFFKALFLQFNFRNVISVQDLIHFLFSGWQLKLGRKSIAQIKEWLMTIL